MTGRRFSVVNFAVTLTLVLIILQILSADGQISRPAWSADTTFTGFSFAQTNLQSLGVPNFEGKTSIRGIARKKWGARLELLDVASSYLLVYHRRGQVYAVAVDRDKDFSAEDVFVAKSGPGNFERVAADFPLAPPTLVQ